MEMSAYCEGLDSITVDCTNGQPQCGGVNFYGPFLESVNLVDLGFNLISVRSVHIQDVHCSARTNAGTACVKISGAGSVGILATGDNFNNWTHDVQNAVNGLNVDPGSSPKFEYRYISAGLINAYRWDDANGLIAGLDSNGASIRELLFGIANDTTITRPSAGVMAFNTAIATNKLATIQAKQLDGARLNTGGTATPTCAVTGAGATATCAINGTSTDSWGFLSIASAGAGPAATGTVTITLSASLGTNNTGCLVIPAQTNTTWNARATFFTSTLSKTAPVLTWDNNAVALVAGNTYAAFYHCFGF